MFPGRRPRLLLPAAPATALGLRQVGTGDARMTIEELRKVRAVAGTHAVDGGIELLLDTGEGDRLALELPLGTLRSLLHTLLLAALERWPALRGGDGRSEPPPPVSLGGGVGRGGGAAPAPVLVPGLRSAHAGPFKVVLEAHVARSLRASLEPIVHMLESRSGVEDVH